MKTALLLKSKSTRSLHFFLILVGGLFFAFLSVLSLHSNEEITSLGFIIFSVSCLYFIVGIDKIEIYTDRIEVKKLLKSKKLIILFNDVKRCSEEVIKKRYLTNNVLTIHSTDKNYKIVSSNYDNYHELRYTIMRKANA